jgi:hypothetical protein
MEACELTWRCTVRSFDREVASRSTTSFWGRPTGLVAYNASGFELVRDWNQEGSESV